MRTIQLRYVGASALLVVVCSFSATSGFRAQASHANPLVGTWRVVAVEDRAEERNPWEHWYGQHPTGYFVYDTTGHVSIQICSDPPIKQFSSSDDFKPTPDEAVAAYTHYLAYFGTYTVDEERHVVTHHVEGSLLPSYTKPDQLRPYVLKANRLELGDGKT